MKTDYEIEREAMYEQREKEFRKGRESMTFHMRFGDKGDFYAWQCVKFENSLAHYGFDHVATKERILEEGLRFNKHSISLGHQYGYDLKNFKSKEEMLGFVIGYNEAINNLEHDNRIKGAQ